MLDCDNRMTEEGRATVIKPWYWGGAVWLRFAFRRRSVLSESQKQSASHGPSRRCLPLSTGANCSPGQSWREQLLQPRRWPGATAKTRTCRVQLQSSQLEQRMQSGQQPSRSLAHLKRLPSISLHAKPTVTRFPDGTPVASRHLAHPDNRRAVDAMAAELDVVGRGRIAVATGKPDLSRCRSWAAGGRSSTRS